MGERKKEEEEEGMRRREYDTYPNNLFCFIVWRRERERNRKKNSK